jgi:hypothetical protein
MVVSVATFLLSNQAQAQYNYSTIDVPSATGTYASGISGNNIVGFYQSSSGTGGWLGSGIYQGGTGTSGFLYNGSSYTTLNDPLAVNGTLAYGTDGNSVVGYYNGNQALTHGFLYNISTASYTTLNDPLGVWATVATGISGNNIVGGYYGISGQQGFLYNGSSYITLEGSANGINGNNVVGNTQAPIGFNGNEVQVGFLYSISAASYATLNDPLAAYGTYANGISGNNVVGYFQDSSGAYHGFLYDISAATYTTLDDPLGVNGTFATGINGSNIVGYYEDSSGNYHSFEATPIPEPYTLALAGLGMASLLAFRRKTRGAGTGVSNYAGLRITPSVFSARSRMTRDTLKLSCIR